MKTDDKKLTAGQRIRKVRMEKSITQTALANAIGVSSPTMSELETGETNLPSLEVALKMSSILGVSLRWIVYGEEGQVLTPTKDESALLSLMRDLTPEARAALIQTARAMSTPLKK